MDTQIKHALEFYCHARPQQQPVVAELEFVVDKNVLTVQVEPTINWVMGSTPRDSRKITVPVLLNQNDSTLIDFSITARNTDVIICGYGNCNFMYATQPVWSDGSSFMDITGHGSDQDLQGPGSLVLPVDVTVKFTAKIQAR